MSAPFDVDVVVIGGGLQGLIALRTLKQQFPAYSCVLISEGAIGKGESLRNHQYVNSGATYPDTERTKRYRACAVESIDLARQLGVAVYENSRLVGPVAALDGKEASLKDCGVPCKRLAEDTLEYDEPTVDIPAFVRALAPESCITGKATLNVKDNTIESVTVNGKTIVPRFTLLCAGLGNAGLLPPENKPVQKAFTVNMLCLRTKPGVTVLPSTSIFLEYGLLAAASKTGDNQQIVFCTDVANLPLEDVDNTRDEPGFTKATCVGVMNKVKAVIKDLSECEAVYYEGCKYESNAAPTAGCHDPVALDCGLKNGIALWPSVWPLCGLNARVGCDKMKQVVGGDDLGSVSDTVKGLMAPPEKEKICHLVDSLEWTSWDEFSSKNA